MGGSRMQDNKPLTKEALARLDAKQSTYSSRPESPASDITAVNSGSSSEYGDQRESEFDDSMSHASMLSTFSAEDNARWVAMNATLQMLRNKKNELQQKITEQAATIVVLSKFSEEQKQFRINHAKSIKANHQQLEDIYRTLRNAESYLESPRRRLAPYIERLKNTEPDSIEAIQTQVTSATQKAAETQADATATYGKSITSLINTAANTAKQAKKAATAAKTKVDSMPMDEADIKIIDKLYRVRSWTNGIYGWFMRHRHGSNGHTIPGDGQAPTPPSLEM